MKSVNIWAMKTAILNSFLTVVWFALMSVPAAEPVQVATLPKTGETARDAAGRLLVKSTRQGDATVHRDASGDVMTYRDAAGEALAAIEAGKR
jgi:hypothetical protein